MKTDKKSINFWGTYQIDMLSNHIVCGDLARKDADPRTHAPQPSALGSTEGGRDRVSDTLGATGVFHGSDTYSGTTVYSVLRFLRSELSETTEKDKRFRGAGPWE